MTGNSRTAWVTGGGRGIGRATAIALARAGHPVAVTARTTSEIEATAVECREHGVDALAVPCDLTDAAAIASAFKEVADALGAPAVLVNNAGHARGIPFLQTSADDMDANWRLNLMGAFHATKLALPPMVQAGWGRIVNVASIAGKVGAPYTTAYATSKHALLGLTRSVAQEFARKGVTSNAVCPGYVDTPMTDRNVELISERTGIPQEDARKHLERTSPQHRFVTPEEVAALVAHLCTEEARGINGQAFNVDGGAVQW